MSETQTEVEVLKNEVAKLKQQLEDLKNDKKSDNHPKKQILDDKIWRIIAEKVAAGDTEYIKQLISNGKISVYDESEDDGHTLLTYAASKGRYDVCQLCLNLGADINHRSKYKGLTALEWANQGAWYHVEQLLTFASMNASIGSEVKQYAEKIDQQNGMTNNFIRYLSIRKNKKVVQDCILDIMINIIRSRLAFSDDLLQLAFNIATINGQSNPLKTNLWETIIETSRDIIHKPNEKDWFWFKTYLLPSTIWLIDCNQHCKQQENEGKQQESHHLFYELLSVVKEKANLQLNDLIIPMNKLIKESDDKWKELISFNINDNEETKNNECRQDMVPNGVKSQFTKEELSKQSTPSAKFNEFDHYDYNEYLSKLILTGHIIDDDFQKSVKNIFNINDDGTYHDEKTEDTIKYIRGPVKLMERAKAKSEVDYKNAKFPTSANVLDINRCSLVFDNIDCMLRSLKLLQNKIKYYQSGSIIDIVRVKNGFKTYIEQAQYADIKLNVLIRNNHGFNIVGEIQFLLQIMMDYKKQAHALYGIIRREELFDNIKAILPTLLNHKTQLFVAGNLGDLNSIYNLMVTHNKSGNDILQIDHESQESILVNMVALCPLKSFIKLQRLFEHTKNDKKLFIQRILHVNRYHDNVVSYVIRDNYFEKVKYLVSIEGVSEIIKNDDEQTYRMLMKACSNGDDKMYQFVRKTFNVTNDSIKNKWADYQSQSKYWAVNIVFAAAFSTQQRFNEMADILGINKRNKLYFDGKSLHEKELQK